jgi:hypothetical protein
MDGARRGAVVWIPRECRMLRSRYLTVPCGGELSGGFVEDRDVFVRPKSCAQVRHTVCVAEGLWWDDHAAAEHIRSRSRRYAGVGPQSRSGTVTNRARQPAGGIVGLRLLVAGRYL